MSEICFFAVISTRSGNLRVIHARIIKADLTSEKSPLNQFLAMYYSTKSPRVVSHDTKDCEMPLDNVKRYDARYLRE